ncbi:subtilisin-like protein [Lactarius psammicola]|nr:subtilisin-like protein [Lactarius psammicola]
MYITLRPHQESALVDALPVIHGTSSSSLLRSQLYARVLLFRSRYGSHPSKEQVAELVRLHPETLELIRSWLVHYGVRSSAISTTHGGAWLTVTDVFMSQANQLIGASYQLYRHAKTSGTIIRTIGYALPATSRRHPVRVRGDYDDAVVTPSYLRGLYKTPAYVPVATEELRPRDSGLLDFMTEYRTDARDATFAIKQVGGDGYDPRNPGIDANIDTQYSGTMAYPTPLIYYNTSGKAPNIQKIISIPYGVPEKNRPLEYVTSLCDLFAQLGGYGVGFPFVSGDDSVGAEDCKDGSGNVRFVPEFSASGCGEVLWRRLLVPLPTPSVPGQDRVRIPPEPRQQACWPLQVPSLAPPNSAPMTANVQTVAGIISLLNDYLISKGRPPLGFLSPRLYGDGRTGLSDIMSGSNPGCNTDGFPVISGWDPVHPARLVTGLGTLDFK